MIDERIETQASLYALGALPPDEAHEFEAALRGNAELRALVQELRATADGMAAGFPRVEPPAGLKAKVMAAIDRRPARPAPAVVVPLDTAPTPGWAAWMPWALAACFAVLCVVLISVGKNLRQQAVALSEDLNKSVAEAEDLRVRNEQLRAESGMRGSNYEQRIVNIERQALTRIEDLGRQHALLTNQLFRNNTNLQSRLATTEADYKRAEGERKILELAMAELVGPINDRLANARIAVVRPTADGPAQAIGAAVWLAPDQRGVMVLEGMQAVPNPATQDYQLWLFDPNAPAPISAGVFSIDAKGSIRHPIVVGVNVQAISRFAVTIEPKGGRPSPTGKIVLASN
jgi:anti-sigma-K factor RskA